ncbi:ATP-binding domain-containing protein [Pseudomonas syringae pv. syringae]|uniref:DEAD/DEAH box helicase n=1 Tax=Pseudomonas syringae TaxID=317 RepID=UPI0016595E9D|nr:ATP-binding domain-containing protein [Pseudomonas syringae]MBC9745011.1 ATP-binding domain-containing protein [Pseudomonas syringae pv. syringae]MBC9749521.1 ATP-binding domain-containing protein [Pseudomonas syringae pv. syringae]MCK9723992.1 ATP-binding domain-containing protein [Pseudomonas syringae pv. syringae]
MNTVEFTRGTNGKPVASAALEERLSTIIGLDGSCFFGYPLIATPEGKYFVDATFLNPDKGVVLFDIVEGQTVGDYGERQDDLVNKIESKLKLHKDLMRGRKLLPQLHVVTFAPAINDVESLAEEGYPLANERNLAALIAGLGWDGADDEIYRLTTSAVESLSSIRKSRSKREVKKPDSLGAKLKKLEDSIATLDYRQNRAVVETVEGVQRIRGLAGSGKTIVLALKAAYLHTQQPDWQIAVTFNTRSLKGQFKRLINNFCIEQSGEEPDWTKLRILNAWGAPGGVERDGIYYEACRHSGSEFYDFRSASLRFGGNNNAFDGACKAALSAIKIPLEVYDTILVDEAQDFSPSFLQLCYSMLKAPKRLVYAYDELQNLSGTSLPPPEDLFGTDDKGRALVSFAGDQRRDVILQKCYRNSRPILVTAHALGFGIYRTSPKMADTGLVQMFEQPSLWAEIGYRVHSGDLIKGSVVSLERTDETSPKFLELHSPIDQLVQIIKFANETEQNAWVAKEIEKNLAEDELRHDDVIVINPDPVSARERCASIRKILFGRGIQSHLAGVDTDADIFFRSDLGSVTFTGIFRAKGNEAGMVYVINAQDCDGLGAGLSTLRNRLFTAITRSKGWVRVVGHGPGMDALVHEFETLQQNDFRLNMRYPTDEQLSKLRIVHRDLSTHEKQRLEQKKYTAQELTQALESGELNAEDLDGETRDKLLQLLSGKK